MAYKMRDNIVPRGMIIGFAGLIASTMAVAAVTHATGAYVVTMPPARALASRELRFEDRPDRGIDIRDAVTGVSVDTVAPKTGGFLRGVMRGLLYEVRYSPHPSDRAPDHAFRLTRWADGRLSLEDETTHQRIELEAFGSTNEQVFAKFLDERVAK